MEKQFTNWHKASYSGSGENCVEQGIASATGAAAVRDTKAKGSGPVLEFAPQAWAAFIGDLKADDRLTGGI